MGPDQARHDSHEPGDPEDAGGRLSRWIRRAKEALGGRRSPDADGEIMDGEMPVQPPRAFRIRVDTLDAEAQKRDVLEAGVCERIFIYGRCHEEGLGAAPAADETLAFHLEGGVGWVGLTDLGRPHGRRCARVKLLDAPEDGTAPPASCVIRITAEPDGVQVTTEVVLGISTGEPQDVVEPPPVPPIADAADPAPVAAEPSLDPGWYEPLVELACRQAEPLEGPLGAGLGQLFHLAGQLEEVGSWLMRTSKEDTPTPDQITPAAIQHLLRLTTTHLAGTLRSAMESLRDRIDQSEPNLTVTLGALRSSTRTAIARLLGDIDHLATLSVPPGDPEVDTALKEWLRALVTTMKRVIGSALRLLANALILAVRFMLHQQMLVFGRSFEALLDRYELQNESTIQHVLAELRETYEVQQPASFGGTKATTDQLWAHLVAFANHGLDEATSSRETTPERWSRVSGVPALTRQLLERVSGSDPSAADVEEYLQQLQQLAHRLGDFEHQVDLQDTQLEHFADQADAVVLGLQRTLVLVASISTCGLAATPPQTQERMAPVEEAAVLLRRTTMEAPRLVAALMGSMALSVLWAVAVADLADAAPDGGRS